MDIVPQSALRQIRPLSRFEADPESRHSFTWALGTVSGGEQPDCFQAPSSKSRRFFTCGVMAASRFNSGREQLIMCVPTAAFRTAVENKCESWLVRSAMQALGFDRTSPAVLISAPASPLSRV
jgi:hypothetical protein